jgi:hypothetical protein
MCPYYNFLQSDSANFNLQRDVTCYQARGSQVLDTDLLI